MLALQLVENEPISSTGLPLDVATDPANQFRFVTDLPTVDWAARTLDADQTAYYAKYDTDKEHPMSRAGHLWSVHLKDE